MDFFDAKKQKQHSIRMAVGYALIVAVVLLGTVILLYQVRGFGLDKNGNVIQNGLVFFSSHPAGAEIFINSQQKAKTNTRIVLPAGPYVVEMKRAGYHPWKRAVTVDGGSVERFDYPMLFPASPATTVTKQYTAAPALATQSQDRRWLLVGAATPNAFDLYDVNATKPVPHDVQVPVDVLAAGSTTQSWQAIDWAGDNRHVLLLRIYQKNGQTGSEYILFDRQDPNLSQNLSVVLGFTPTALYLRNHAYDQYYAFDVGSGEVFTASLKKPTPQPYLGEVLAFDADDNTALYVTTQGAPAGRVLVRVRHNDDTAYTVRQLSAGTPYVLDSFSYNGTPFVAAGAQSEDKVYVYKDPLATLTAGAQAIAVPVEILKVPSPTYVSFSLNGRFVMAESGARLAVYDAETDKGYAFTMKAAPDAPQPHASWMDGFRLAAVVGGKLQEFDFDGTNQNTLGAASPSYLPFFDHDYRFVYAFNAESALTSTSLLAPQDQ